MTIIKRRPRILIIYTGGTIGMTHNPLTGMLQPFDFSHLIDNVPKVRLLDYEIEHVQFDEPIDSANMDIGHWQQIARIIEERYDRHDGFVVLHGTDTMAFTASALSFMLENLHKPVIITGSQLPIGEVRTDGEENLITALQVSAATNSIGEPMVQEVAILFENNLWRGNRSTKMSANNFDAFKSHNYPALANIGLSINFNTDALYRSPSKRPLQVHDTMDSAVMFVRLNPGMTADTLDYMVNAPHIKGIVLETYGAGNSPNRPWFTEPLRRAVERGLVVVNVSQCVNGRVVDSLYETGNMLASIGVVSGHDITAEAAITKLMYLFGLGLKPDAVKAYMGYSLCGEITI